MMFRSLTTACRTFGLALPALLCFALLAPGCGDDDSGGEGEGEGEGEFQFEEGEFDVSTHEVQDECYDGAFSVLFMPEGANTPKDFQYPIRLPNPEALKSAPETYSIQLQEPFNSMDITMEYVGPREMRVNDAVNPGVILDEASYGDCSADLTINFDVQLLDEDKAQAAVDISMSNLHGDDGRCPDVEDGCTVHLSIQAVRR